MNRVIVQRAVLVSAVFLFVAAFLPLNGDMERYWLAHAGSQITIVPFHVPQTLGAGSQHPDAAWIDQEWLVAFLFAGLQAHGLFLIAGLALGLCGAWLIIFTYRECVQCRVPPVWTLVLVALATWMIALRLQYRSEPFAFALFAFTITTWRSRRLWPLAIPAICVWANVQGSVAVGVAWMILYTAFHPPLRVLRLIGLAAAVLAAMLNPNGIGLFTVPAHLYTSVGRVASEWAPAYAGASSRALLLIITSLFVLRALRSRLRRRTLLFERVCGVVAIATLAGPTRNLFPFAIFGFPWVMAWFRGGFPLRVPRATFAVATAGAFALLLGVLGYQRTSGLTRGGSAFGLPQTRVESDLHTLSQHIPQSATVFTDDAAAGSWLLFSGREPTFDGRLEAYAALGTFQHLHAMNGARERYAIVVAQWMKSIDSDGWRTQQTAGDYILAVRTSPTKSTGARRSNRAFRVHSRTQPSRNV